MNWLWLRIRQAFNVNSNVTSLSEPDVVLGLLQTLRACDTVTPPPGFYDRVQTRIEQIEQQSIWIPVIYSRVTVRLAIACFCFSLALFGYVFGTEGNANSQEYTMSAKESDWIFSARGIQQQRDAVLMEIKTHLKRNQTVYRVSVHRLWQRSNSIER